MGEEALADSLAAELRTHEEVFQVQAGAAEPGGVVIEEQGEAGGLPIPLRDEDAELGFGAEAVSREVRLRRGHGLRLALVGGEFADELEDQLDVARGGRPDVQHGEIPERRAPLLDRPLDENNQHTEGQQDQDDNRQTDSLDKRALSSRGLA